MRETLDAFVQVIVSGLTLGGMYAVSVIGLALVWGVVGMLNMAHGAMLAIGGYASLVAVQYLGLPWMFGLPAAVVIGVIAGALVYYGIVHWMVSSPLFETNIIIATVGLAIVITSVMTTVFSGYPKKQPFFVEGGVRVSEILVPYQTIIIIIVALAMMFLIYLLLSRTRMGRAIRATAQDQRGAQIVGVPVKRVFLQVMMIAGAVAGLSGVMLSSVSTLSPQVGTDPMLKAFIICVIAGLCNVPGAMLFAFVLGLFEVGVQFIIGSKWGFPAMLVVAIIILIWRPYGVFGQRTVRRV